MKVINLTKHDVNICDNYGRIIKTYKPSGMEARCRHGYGVVEYMDGVPVVVRTNEHMVDLPEPKEGFAYIVSNIVLNNCPDRSDLFAPVKLVYENGRVIGCKALAGNR